jgi:hypothetical protein
MDADAARFRMLLCDLRAGRPAKLINPVRQVLA